MSSEIVPKTPYVIVRNGTCYFDMRVPLDVVGAYKRQFKLKTGGAIRFSLRTKDRRQAQRLAAKHLGHYEELFAELRRSGDTELVLANKVGRRDLSKLSRPELEKCPSSDDLRLFRCLRNGGSGSSGFEVMRPATGAASVFG